MAVPEPPAEMPLIAALVYGAARGLGELAVHTSLAKRTCDGDDMHFDSFRLDALGMRHGIATYRMPHIDAE